MIYDFLSELLWSAIMAIIIMSFVVTLYLWELPYMALEELNGLRDCLDLPLLERMPAGIDDKNPIARSMKGSDMSIDGYMVSVKIPAYQRPTIDRLATHALILDSTYNKQDGGVVKFRAGKSMRLFIYLYESGLYQSFHPVPL